MKNDQTFNKICNMYYASIYKFCNYQLQNSDAAKECTQETFLTLYRKMPYLNLSQDLGAWLYKTASNHIKAYKRKNPNNHTSLDEVENILTYSLEYSDIKNLLSKDEYTLVVDYYINKNPVENIAKKYKITKSGVYTRLQKIKKKLLKIYGKAPKQLLIPLLLLKFYTNFIK
ncbi:MAG: sigma-70 family RNA polymerase sigma factor [Oscillospiraceae bacterium]